MEILILGGVAIVGYVGYKFYEKRYFESEEFLKMKDSYDTFVQDCNGLNKHINEIETHISLGRKENLGVAKLSDNSNYNYKRGHQVLAKSSEDIYECSATVVKNAQAQPFKYICKYFNIEKNEETLKVFEEALNRFSTIEEGKTILKRQMRNLNEQLNNQTPNLIKNEKIRERIGMDNISLNYVKFPSYTFRYISPGGNKTSVCSVEMDIDNLNLFIEYLAEGIKNQKTAKGQRALMTSKLRTKIKERDNYTCQNPKCGVSIKDEPHLLLEIDHIIPVSKGGLSTEKNLQTLCWKCNRTKGAK